MVDIYSFRGKSNDYGVSQGDAGRTKLRSGEGGGGEVDRGDTKSLIAQYREYLEAFVVRARRVEEHSLAADWDALVRLAEIQMRVVALDNGDLRIRHEYPAEEVVESAAARLRPILLEGDACYYQKALKALGYFCRTLPRDSEWLRSARSEWRTRVQPTTAEEAGYWVMVSNAATGEDHRLDRHRLAMAWIYGDVVHHDTGRRQEADPFGLVDRFRAAVPLIAWAMVGTIELLNYIRVLQEAGQIQLSQKVFDERVALKSTTWEKDAEVYFAPVGTEPPTAAVAPLPAQWAQLDSSVDLSVFRTESGAQLLQTVDQVAEQ
ncbi:hypothetical protein [Streptomyces sp. NPDC005244]|uniref:hypothetical protein n=1 Tax=Streptomyces sp. NPDC005244 TaxID=3364708 RepID=UPI003682D3CE